MNFEQRYQNLFDEATRLKSQGRVQDAEAREVDAAGLLEEARNRAEQNVRDPKSADTLLFLAEREWLIRGDDPAVQSKLEQARAIREECFGAEDPRTADAVTKLAEFHFLAGRWGEAESRYREALAIYESRHVSGTALDTQCRGGLAQALAALGRAAEADPHFAAAISASEGRDEHKRALYFLYTYRAEGLEKLGRHAEAEELRRKAAGLLPRNNPGEQGFHV